MEEKTMKNHSEICPVCEGEGYKITQEDKITCNGCQGRGYVVIPNTSDTQNESENTDKQLLCEVPDVEQNILNG